jgi:hypothetical protein
VRQRPLPVVPHGRLLRADVEPQLAQHLPVLERLAGLAAAQFGLRRRGTVGRRGRLVGELVHPGIQGRMQDVASIVARQAGDVRVRTQRARAQAQPLAVFAHVLAQVPDAERGEPAGAVEPLGRVHPHELRGQLRVAVHGRVHRVAGERAGRE